MELGKPPKVRRPFLIMSAIAVLVALTWSMPAVQEWYLWSCTPVSQRPSTRGNMHSVQLAVEDFAIEHDGRFPSTSAELAPYLRGLRLHNSFTKRPLTVIVRPGPPAREDDTPELGAVVVERPDSANYVIRGCARKGTWMEFQLRNDPELGNTP